MLAGTEIEVTITINRVLQGYSEGIASVVLLFSWLTQTPHLRICFYKYIVSAGGRIIGDVYLTLRSTMNPG